MKFNKDELLRFYKKFRIFIFPAVVTLSCLILIIFVIYPQAEKLILNQKRQSDLASRSSLLEAKAATLENINEVKLSNELNIALSSYPVDRDFGNIIGIIRSVANQNGFDVSGMAVNPGKEAAEGGEKYSVRVELSGSKSLLPRFIKALESQPRIMKLSAMEVTKTQLGDGVIVLAEIEVLYARPPQSFGGTDSKLPTITSADEELIATLATFSRTSITSAPSATISTPRGKANPFE